MQNENIEKKVHIDLRFKLCSLLTMIKQRGRHNKNKKSLIKNVLNLSNLHTLLFTLPLYVAEFIHALCFNSHHNLFQKMKTKIVFLLS